MREFIPCRLTQARNWNCCSLEYLAGMIGVTKSSIGLYEKGARRPDESVQIRMAAALKFPIEFFSKSALDTSSNKISYRKKAGTRKTGQYRAELFKQFSIEFTEVLSEYVNFKESAIIPLDIPSEELSDDDIERIASKFRKDTNAGLGPINDLMTFLENRGAFIFLYNNSITTTDGFSCTYSSRPYIYINEDYSWDRIRFTLAHELGHIILHSCIDDTKRQNNDFYKKIERQANIFAGAFLFPKKSFFNEFMGINNNCLLELKKKWGMSKAAIIKRAKRLNLITDIQEQSFFTGASRRNERKVEDGSNLRKKETPFLIKTVIDTLLEKQILDNYYFITQCGFPDDILAVLSSNTISTLYQEKPQSPFILNS